MTTSCSRVKGEIDYFHAGPIGCDPSRVASGADLPFGATAQRLPFSRALLELTLEVICNMSSSDPCGSSCELKTEWSLEHASTVARTLLIRSGSAVAHAHDRLIPGSRNWVCGMARLSCARFDSRRIKTGGAYLATKRTKTWKLARRAAIASRVLIGHWPRAETIDESDLLARGGMHPRRIYGGCGG